MSEAPVLAALHLDELGDRWKHVKTAGSLAETLRLDFRVQTDVWSAAWLHDLGYAPSAIRTGFHPLDGAVYLQRMGVPEEVVALVAWHTGARFEAEERGLTGEMSRLPKPSASSLDALTLIDLVSAPDGTLTTPHLRIAEILRRYGPEEVVHKAVQKSRSELLASAARARTRLGLADVWPLGVLKSVNKA